MAKSPFANMHKIELGFARVPFLSPKNVVRDPTLNPKKNIIASETATYGVRMDSAEIFEAQEGGDMFKVTMTVVQGDGPNPVGSQACFMIPVATRYFQRDVGRWMCGTMNAPPPAFHESDYERVISKEQPITGRFALVRVSNTKTTGKKNPESKGNDFTQHEWSPAEVVTNEQGQMIGLKPAAVDNVAAWMAEQKFSGEEAAA